MLHLVNLLTNKLQHIQHRTVALNLHLKWQDRHLLNTAIRAAERWTTVAAMQPGLLQGELRIPHPRLLLNRGLQRLHPN